MAEQLLECNRSDLLILDSTDLEAGPVATVRLPFRIFGQIHGWWVSADALPQA
jgi:carotenoid cleavage dioxygenase